MSTRDHEKSNLKYLTSKHLIVAAAVCLGTGFGCAADPSDDGAQENEPMPPLEVPDEENLNLVAELNLDSQRIKYFEPKPGVLLEMEMGRPDPNRAPEPANLSIVERYEFLAGGPAPAALVEAAERAKKEDDTNDSSGEESHGQFLEEQPGQELPADQDNLIAKHSWHDAATESWFYGSYCSKVHRFWGTSNTYWTGYSYWSDRTEYARAGIYVKRGSVQADISASMKTTLGRLQMRDTTRPTNARRALTASCFRALSTTRGTASTCTASTTTIERGLPAWSVRERCRV